MKFRFQPSASFRKYSRNTAWIFGERIVRILILIPVTALLARYLGPEQVGIYNLAVSLVAIFAIISTVGMPNILVREIVRDKGRTNELVMSGLGLRLAAAVLFYGAAVGASWLLQYSRFEIALISIIGFRILLQSFDVFDNYLQANVALRASSKVRLAAVVVGSGAKLWLIFTQAPLLHFAWVYLVEFLVIAALFTYLYYRMTGFRLKPEASMTTGKQLLQSSLPLIYYSALLTINMKVDQVMITKMLGNEANGYYSVVVALIETLYFIPMALGTAVFPGLIKQREADRHEDYHRAFALLYELLLLISVGVTVVFFFGAPFIIHLLYGTAFEPSVAIMRIYAFTPILMFYASMRNRWLIIEDLHRFSPWFLGVALVVNIALNLALLPVMGASGAVVALLVSYVVSFLIVPYLIPATRVSVHMFFEAFLFRRLREVLRTRTL